MASPAFRTARLALMASCPLVALAQLSVPPRPSEPVPAASRRSDPAPRLEPQPSRGTTRLEARLTKLQQQVERLAARDGTTAVIGGLLSEELVESQHRIPYLSALPLVGRAFTNTSESIDRTELIVLITRRQHQSGEPPQETSNDQRQPASHAIPVTADAR